MANVNSVERGYDTHAQKSEQQRALRPHELETLPHLPKLDYHHGQRTERDDERRPQRIELLLVNHRNARIQHEQKRNEQRECDLWTIVGRSWSLAHPTA